MKRTLLIAIALLAIGLLALGCRGGARTPRDVKIPVRTPTSAPQRCFNATYPAEAPQFNGDQFSYVKLASGLEIFEHETGTGGTPRVGDDVTGHFTGFLPDGCVFTTTRTDAEPVQITLDEAMISGLREGLTTMQAGGKRRLRAPAALAYGQQGLPGRVPPNSTVIFEIDLREVIEVSATSTPSEQTPVVPPAGTPSASPGAGQ